jgi:hypothetical protein
LKEEIKKIILYFRFITKFPYLLEAFQVLKIIRELLKGKGTFDNLELKT